MDAFEFVQLGLNFTVNKLHGAAKSQDHASRHVTGRELCEGLRELALMQWGFLAGTVLSRWNITSSMDFGRIVFAMVDNGYLRKSDEDSVEDFRDAIDFRAAFDSGYRIPVGS